jgi:hypothetical protein
MFGEILMNNRLIIHEYFSSSCAESGNTLIIIPSFHCVYLFSSDETVPNIDTKKVIVSSIPQEGDRSYHYRTIENWRKEE